MISKSQVNVLDNTTDLLIHMQKVSGIEIQETPNFALILQSF